MMRACPLRAALSKTESASQFVLGNPKAWLGTAYHAVLERISDETTGGEALEPVIDRLWARAIAQQEATAQAHPLDVRFGRAQTWPGYHLARASVGIRAAELVRAPGPPGRGDRLSRSGGTAREQRLTAFGGKLVGYPDVIRGDDIIDYKSGAIVEYDDVQQAEVIKAAYVRQLRIYGALVKEARGTWPRRGILLPPVGTGVEIPLEEEACTREANDAVARLDDLNRAIQSTTDTATLATPSPAGCKWCSYKLICTAFWGAANPSWSSELDGAAIEARVASVPQSVHGGAAVSLALTLIRGSESARVASLTPLSPTAQPVAATLAVGDLVRAIGLRTRTDGTLVPTPRTVLAKVDSLPRVVVHGETPLRGEAL